MFLNFRNYFCKKLGRVNFSSFWSYEPAFRQEGGEGEVVTNGRMDGRTDGRMNGRTESPLLDSDQLRWAE